MEKKVEKKKKKKTARRFIKKDQKGFTLMEVLTVVIILVVLATIAIPTVSSIIKKTRQRYYTALEGNLKVAAMDYYSDNRSERPKYNLSTNQVSLATLVENQYMKDEVVDASGNATCASSYVRVLKEAEGKYEYTTCLVCKDYKSDVEYCEGEYDPDQNDHIYTLEVPDKVKSYINNPIDVSRLTKATLKARGREVSKVTASAASVSGVDVTKKYTYPDQVAYQVLLENGTTLEAKTTDLEIYQNKAPEVTLYQASSSNYSDTTYKDKINDQNQWVNKNVKESLEVKEDYPDEFSAIQILNETTNTWETYCTSTKCEKTDRINQDKIYVATKQVRGIDKKGNVSEVGTYTVKIDKVAPECALEVTAGTSGKNNWYTTDVTIGFKSKTDQDSGVASFGLNNSNTAKYDNATTFKMSSTGTTYGYVKDHAGNTGTCSIKQNIDKDKPTCSINVTGGTKNSNGWYNKSPLTLSLSKSSDVTVYGLSTSQNSTNKATSQKHSSDTTSTKYYGYVEDAAGNTASCQTEIKLDTQPPTFGSTNACYPSAGYREVNGEKSYALVTTINDSLSGISSVKYQYCYTRINGKDQSASSSKSTCKATALVDRPTTAAPYYQVNLNKVQSVLGFVASKDLDSAVNVRWHAVDQAGNEGVATISWAFARSSTNCPL